MATFEVRAPSAPIQAIELGAWPSICFHGWKWSLTNTDSKPAFSAWIEKSSSLPGANCSADALYPSLSTVMLPYGDAGSGEVLMDRHAAHNRPMVVVVMGVSSSGKTTVAKLLAETLGWQYQEGDALHPPENVAKMSSGTPLTDADRLPWLRAIAARIDEWRSRGEPGVVTCSALKRAYRDIIVGNRPDVVLVYLKGSHDLIAARMAA